MQNIEFLKRNIIFRNTDVFDGLDDEVLKETYEIIHFLHHGPGDVIFKKGEKGDSIVLILQGEVGVYVEDNKGKEMNVASVGENSFVGEMAIIDDSNRTATVKTISNSLLATIYSSDFWTYFQKNHVLAKNVLQAINRRLREINSNFINRMIREKEELERQVQEKTEQLRQKDIQLLEKDRIAGIATLAAGIAHEINNPLSFIKSSIGFVKKSTDKMVGAVKYWDDKPVPEPLLKEYKEYLTEINFDHVTCSLNEKFDRIKKGIERIMKIVNSLRSFSRVDREDRGNIDINQSITEAIEILNSNEVKNIEFVKDLQQIPLIECSANEIHQCLLHTIQNAIDAVDDNGIIKIMTSYNEQDNHIFIRIVDNGKGMSEEVLRQALNPFFTTKPVGSGTGVGLSITEKIISKHNGKIELSGKEGEGTTVSLMLPGEGGRSD